MVRCACFLILIAWQLVVFPIAHADTPAIDPRPNLLLITVDDINADSIGIYGSAVANTTPNIDQLAREGIRFQHAHVQVANCTPSRNVMWSGRYPHTNKVEGFYPVLKPGYDTLSDVLHSAGYFTAIRNKVNGSTPYAPYGWDLVLDHKPGGGKHHKYDPESYGLSTTQGILAAKAAGKPFSLMMNISDAHIPFYGVNKKGQLVQDAHLPSRIYGVDDIVVPGFLVDDPLIRQELSHYYSSVRRADDTVGYILKALEESGEADKTLVMFLSDHGMPFPFAKTQLYHHSTWTPLIFRWPGEAKAGSVDAEHLVSAVDLMPTLLDAVGAGIPVGVEGRSILPLLRGKPQEGREFVFKEYNENSAAHRAPMRAVQSAQYLYVFNPWSDGSRMMTSATMNTGTYKRMMELATQDEKLAARMNLLNHRVVEELYDVEKDPDCLVNLIDAPEYTVHVDGLRLALENHMRKTADPALEVFLHRGEPAARVAFMQEQAEILRQRNVWLKAIREKMKPSSNKVIAPAPEKLN